jgi:RNA polymerase sigma-70 factor, ECF subfamily
MIASAESAASGGRMWSPRYLERKTSLDVTANLNQHSASFEQMAIPLLDSTYNFAFWLTRDRDKAEDLVQESYRKALRGFALFTPGSNFRAWMFRILKNTFLTSCSAAGRVNSVPLNDEEVQASEQMQSNSTESTLLLKSEAKMLRTAIEQLPLQFREIITLCDLEETSYREAAEILSIPIGTVMSRLSRARNALRIALSSRTSVFAAQKPPAFRPVQS